MLAVPPLMLYALAILIHARLRMHTAPGNDSRRSALSVFLLIGLGVRVCRCVRHADSFLPPSKPH